MAQRDWHEVFDLIDKTAPGFWEEYMTGGELFSRNFSAKELGKEKPGNWIPVYKKEHLPEWFHEKKIMPIRAGQAEFFFLKGDVFFDLADYSFSNCPTDSIESLEDFFPATLHADFQRNENAYLNKAMALGYINHFIKSDALHVLKREIATQRRTRLLYGQFGKIRTTVPFRFATSAGSRPINPGFQFEIDLVLESPTEIIIIEAKCGSKLVTSFSLLQLYYPLIYFRSVLKEQKKIRTVFIDIVTDGKQEAYRMLEVAFEGERFDMVRVLKDAVYDNGVD